MSEKTVGIRELKMNLSKYLAEVRTGTRIVITEHSRSMANLAQEKEEQVMEDRIMSLRDAGILKWNGKKIDVSLFQPVSKLRKDVLASDLLLEDRD